MNEPVRLRESGTDDVRALLRNASRPRPMAEEERARGERRVARLAAVPVALGLLFWLKGIAMGAAMGAVVVTGVVTVQSLQSSSPSRPGPSVEPPVVATTPARPLAASSSPQPAHSEAIPVPAAPALSLGIPTLAPQGDDAGDYAVVDTLAQEASLVERARGALRSDPGQALSLTAEHARRFPSGQLGMERELVAIEALQKLGRGSEARARADALLHAAPGSLYEERIHNLFPAPR